MKILKPRSRVARRFMQNRLAVAALLFLFVLILIALFAPLIAPKDPASQDLLRRLEGPSSDYWLGTDGLGRDMLSRLIFGIRTSLVATGEALLIAVAIGVPLGLLAGHSARWIDSVLSRIADALYALPPIILAMAIIGALGPGLTNAMIAVGIVLAPRFFRVARAAADSIGHETYIEAARTLGFSTPRILGRHVLPNSSGPLLIQTSFACGVIIAAEASLSFLGLGVQLPKSSLGGMVRDGFNNIQSTAWGVIVPSIMIVGIVLAFSVLGDGLRDALSRQRKVGS